MVAIARRQSPSGRIINPDQGPVSWQQRLLGHDSIDDFLYVLTTAVAFVVLDRWTARPATLAGDRFDSWSIAAASASSNATIYLSLGLIAVGLFRAPQRMLARWDVFEHGLALRRFAAPLLVYATWTYSLYDYNVLLDRWHAPDRLAIVALGIAAWFRPLFLGPFVMQARLIVAQIALPYGNEASANLDDLLLLCLLAIAGAHFLHVATDQAETSGVLLVIAAALAAHFFIPGKSKIELGWLFDNNISDLPRSGYAAGWRAGGDGTWSRNLAQLLQGAEPFVKVATLTVELGALIALTHRRLLALWLPAAVLFHLGVFASTGFWFLPWILIELGLLLIIMGKALRPWVSRNATPARTLLSVVLVLPGGSVLFHPPGLGWIDAPVSYGYRFQGLGEDGQLYNLAPSDFGLLDSDLSFLRLRVSATEPLSGGYGALASSDDLERMRDFTNLTEVRNAELVVVPPRLKHSRETAVEVLGSFLRATADARSQVHPPWDLVSPPDRFWTSAPEPRYRFDQALIRIEVYLVRDLHSISGTESASELVLRLTLDDDGREIAEFGGDPGT